MYRGTNSNVENPNQTPIHLKTEKREVLEMNMESIQFLYDFHKSQVIGDASMDLFFGIILSEFPKIEIGGLGFTEPSEFFKKIFYEEYMTFMKEWWISHHVWGGHAYRFVLLEEFGIYVPRSMDMNRGIIYCLYDYDNTGSQEFKWKHLEPMSVNGIVDESETIMVDDKIGFLISKPFRFPKDDDNIMQWYWYINGVNGNKRWMRPLRSLTHCFDSPLSKCIEPYYNLLRLREAEIQTELLKSNLHLGHVMPSVDWKNEPMGNYIDTWAKTKDDSTKLRENIHWRESYNLNKKNKIINQMQPQLDSFQQSMLSTQQTGTINNGQPSNASPYIIGNPSIENVTNLDTYWGGVPTDREEIENAFENARTFNVGISNHPIRRDEFVHIRSTPGEDIRTIPKYTTKDYVTHETRFNDSISTAYSGLSDYFSTSSRDAAQTILLKFEKMKLRVLAIMKLLETAMNTIWRNLIQENAQVIKMFIQNFENVKLPNGFFEVKFHFQPTWTYDMDTLFGLYDRGIFDGTFVQNIALKLFGLHDIRDGLSIGRRNLVPKPPIDLRQTTIDHKGKSGDDEGSHNDKDPKKKRKKQEDVEKKHKKKNEEENIKKKKKKKDSNDQETVDAGDEENQTIIDS